MTLHTTEKKQGSERTVDDKERERAVSYKQLFLLPSEFEKNKCILLCSSTGSRVMYLGGSIGRIWQTFKMMFSFVYSCVHVFFTLE